MYDAKAEKRPVSLGFAPRSMTWEGVCKGIGAISMLLDVAKNGGINELTNKFNQILEIYACN